MRKILGVFLLTACSLSAVEIPIDSELKSFSLKKGIEIWIKEHFTTPAQVACRFVGQDPIQGKPQIFDLECPAEIFEEELPNFLDYCEEEIERKGGASLGLVAVGVVDPQGLHSYLSSRYDHLEVKNRISEEAVQVIYTKTNETDVQLSYPTVLFHVKTDEDLKKLWVFYLIQSMAENRFKKAAALSEGKWIAPDETRYMLPAYATVGHAIQKSGAEERLLKGFLMAIQELKEKGFTESELAASKSQLLKHLKRFYQENPNEKTLADYYASHLAASLSCSDYPTFMELSFQMIPQIAMTDIAQMLKSSFRDDSRQVVLHSPEGSAVTSQTVKEILKAHTSDSLEFVPEELTKIDLEEGKDAFSQLPITDDEQKMIRSVIQIVAETNPIKLGFIRSDLEKKRLQLLHIHPLRSISAMFTDSYTKQCVAEIMDSFFKWKSFISDFSKRMNQESDRDNLHMYVQGFCLTLKANPDQVRMYINNKEWEKLVKYLVKLN